MTGSLLPSNRTEAEEAFDAATARIGAVPVDFAPLWDPDRCPEEFLPWLAWALSVDTWDPAWPVEVRREVLRQSVTLHRLKGTVGSIRRAPRAAGYGDAEIRESDTQQRHDGSVPRNGSRSYARSDHWAEYRLKLMRAVTVEQGQQVRAILRATAPARCRLKVMDFTAAARTHNRSFVRDGTYSYGAT